jgi:3alpha(or 20beta)-hydroxysteroid dehydrogenase
VSDRLEGRVILISGAARGQGEAEARLFVAEGACVVLGDILEDRGIEVARSLGASAIFVNLDVSSETDWSQAVGAAIDEFGKVDGLINNAGVRATSRPLTEYSLADYRAVIDVNQVGVFLGMRAVAPAIAGAGGGTIVNVSSVAGMTGVAGSIAYTASKWAVRGMTKTAALELGSHGIRVNSIHPGGIDTPMIADLLAVRPRVASGSRYGAGRIGTVAEIATIALFLSNDESSMCTGSEFVADDGSLAGISWS